MYSITDYQETIYNPILEEKAKGFLDASTMESLKQNYTYGYVLKGMEYRPDLVANYYLGSVNYSWLITYVNEFFKGVSEYTVGRKIKIPKI